jgi:hypothetical protein
MRDPRANLAARPRFDCDRAAGGICDRPSRQIAARLPGDPMTTFDDRERGFEKRFALDQEQEFKASAKRNRALGEWAAGLMGLTDKHIAEYAQAVVKSDLEQPGEDDVLRKVFEDLKGSGVQISEGEVRMKMAELLAQAREQVREGK